MLDLGEVLGLMQEGKIVMIFEEDENGLPVFNVKAENGDLIDLIDFTQLSNALLFASLLGFENPKVVRELMEEFVSMDINQ